MPSRSWRNTPCQIQLVLVPDRFAAPRAQCRLPTPGPAFDRGHCDPLSRCVKAAEIQNYKSRGQHVVRQSCASHVRRDSSVTEAVSCNTRYAIRPRSPLPVTRAATVQSFTCEWLCNTAAISPNSTRYPRTLTWSSSLPRNSIVPSADQRPITGSVHPRPHSCQTDRGWASLPSNQPCPNTPCQAIASDEQLARDSDRYRVLLGSNT